MDPHNLLLISSVLCLDDEEEPPRKKRLWCKQWLQKRPQFSHVSLIKELQNNQPMDFSNYLRMDSNDFHYLLERLRPQLTKKTTNMREPVSAEERLIATLRFLATGRNYEDIKFSCIISPQLLGKIIPEVCELIYNTLKDDYMKVGTIFVLLIKYD